MTGKKYQQYKVKITYLNGDTETINYENYNENSYKEMLNAYKDTKEKFKDDCVTIDFLGISEDGQVGVLFQKQLVNRDELEIKKEADEVENISASELISKLNELVEIINKKQFKEGEKINILNKKQDVLLHKFEHLDKIEFEDEKIINVAKELYLVRKQRREAKDNFFILSCFINKFDNKAFKEIINETKVKIKQTQVKKDNAEFLTDEKVVEFKIIKEVSYKNFKERINLVKQLTSKYDKVYYDDSKMVVTCYNKAH